MNESKRNETFARNLALIERLYPQYVPILQNASSSVSGYRLAAVEGGAWTCKADAPDGERWLHGPADPWLTARSALHHARWEEQRLFVVLRPGLGYLPLELYSRMRKGRFAQRMLIIEDRTGLLRLGLELFDWTDLLRSDRVILSIDRFPADAAMNFFQTNPSAALTPISVLCGVEWTNEEQHIIGDLQQRFPPMADQIFAASRQYLNDLHQHYRRAGGDPAHKRRVLFVEPEHDYLADSMSEGFIAEGCETASFKANPRLVSFLNPYVWLVYTRENFPDVMLWMNRNTLSPEGAETLSALPIKKALWFLDSPKRVKTTREELAGIDAIFSFDKSYVGYLSELSGKPCLYLPTAAGIQPMPECEPEKDWPRREGPDVGFMGALAVQRYQDVRAFWQERDPAFVDLLDGVVEAYMADESVTLEARYLAEAGDERPPYEGFVTLYLEERVTYLKRLNALRRVVDLGLKTYGAPEWGREEWACELTPCYAGFAPKYREDLPSVYYHTKVNVNVFHAQCADSTNPRVYDVLAAGGFLLTEYRPAIEDEFIPGEHLVCYRNEDELRELTEYYLSHDGEREAIARAGQRRVFERCAYAHRAHEILRAIDSAG